MMKLENELDLEKEKENEQENEVVSKEERKKIRIEKERKDLINKVIGGNIGTTRERVAFVLNNSIPARNSDIELAWEYWKTFENDIFGEAIHSKEQLRALTSINTLTRSRARIQNDYKLFQADDVVKKHRGKLEEDKKQEAIEEKPNWPFYEVFIDETGKTQKYLSVGSLWIVDARSKVFAYRKIKDWIKSKNIDFEFHFTKVSRHRIDNYKQFFLNFLSWNPSTGFKIIVVENKGFSNINNAITDLTFHLINDGVQHEHDSNRAPLPRLLQIRLDNEEEGSDQLKLKNLEERISRQKIEGLELDSFVALDSKNNYFIQAVDLFTAAVNRKLHNQNSSNIKDELADYILSLVNFDVSKIDKSNSEIDKAVVFNLTHNVVED